MIVAKSFSKNIFAKVEDREYEKDSKIDLCRWISSNL